ncbi:hypothetical protein V1477_011994 [Vespula maculifrons]|uniref:Uncharacterized protein n=4 Tax=Vespula TaxID=7451 RepID=A0A834MX10_VESGE|nr:hypothetical protein HZH68_012234 [Vespula germanica]KAF7410639.1 hypothetical protein H0235_013246 [Vespula pensylvanica]
MESVAKPLPWRFAPQLHLDSPYLTSPCFRLSLSCFLLWADQNVVEDSLNFFNGCPVPALSAPERLVNSIKALRRRWKKAKREKETRRARVLKEEEKIVKDAIVITISSGKLLAICDATLEIVQTAN